MPIFSYTGDQFAYDGHPLRLLSGGIHYFRIVPEYWRDRLLKLKACGFNTVETYVPWNLHEPKEGEFNFSGLADLEAFVTLAGQLELHVIVRPSPYICAEWEFGGLPSWLLSYPEIGLRCNDPVFLEKVNAYYDVLIPKLTPLLCTNGGPIIAIQVENEYGSYGNDQTYLQFIKQGLIDRGIDVLLFTSDGPTDQMLQGGMIPGVLATVNFGSRTAEAFKKLREYQPEGPLMCMEYWNGWFDHWGEKHHTRETASAAYEFEEMMKLGASVNFYMFHGGTNFGFYNGANHINTYEPTVTSYDYDSLLNEHGEPTEKYFVIREVLAKYESLEALELPVPLPTKSYGVVKLAKQANLFNQLDKLSQPMRRTRPEPMEKIGQNYGFICYSTIVSGPRDLQELVLQDVHDRAQIFLDGKYLGVVERWNPKPIQLSVTGNSGKLDILVENMGRINYGPLLKDFKGITEGVRLDNQFLYDWTIHPLPLESLDDLDFGDLGELKGPAFYKGELMIEEVADTFIRLEGWTKGVVYVNGFVVGRYWEKGPQKTLYIPGPLLRQGLNEIVVFELHSTGEASVVLEEDPELGEVEHFQPD